MGKENDARVELTYWSDPRCVWAFVAHEKLVKLRQEFGQSVQVQHRIVPVFGSITQRLRDGVWAKAGVEGRVASMQRICKEHAGLDVSCEVWRRDPPASSWAPSAAVKGVQALVARGEIPDGMDAEYLWRMRRWFFEDNRNVVRRAVQLELAESLDIPTAPLEETLDDGSAFAALWEDHEERERLKLRGSPTYVFAEGRAQLYGNFPYGLLHAAVEEMMSSAPGASDC